MTSTLLATLITTALTSGHADIHAEHSHDQSGACVILDAADDPRSIPNLRQALTSNRAVNAFGLMSETGDVPVPVYSETTPIVLDVAVWYRPTYLSVISEQQIHARVEYWFSVVNEGFRNSDLNVVARPLFVKNMDYDIRHLEHLIWDGFDDWFTDETNNTYHYDVPLRKSPISQYASLMITGDLGLQLFSDELQTDFYKSSFNYGADLHLWVQEGVEADFAEGEGVMGVATMLGEDLYVIDQSTVHPNQSEASEQATLYDTALTIFHEIGHTVGLFHEQANYDDGYLPRTGTQAFAYAQCGVSRNTTTAMWSRSRVGNPRRLIYSNPDVLVEGQACGDPVWSDQASVVRENAPVASVRGIEQSIAGSVSFAEPVVMAYSGYDNVLFEVVRDGDLSVPAEVELGLIDGTAVEGVDFTGGAQQLYFAEGQDRIVASIDVKDIDASRATSFLAVLRYPLNVDIDGAVSTAVLGADQLSSAKSVVSTSESVSFAQNGRRTLEISRVGNISEAAYVYVKSVDATAIGNVNYIPFDTYVYFAPGEDAATLDIEVLRTSDTRNFAIELSASYNVELSSDYINVSIVPHEAGAAHFVASNCASTSDCVATSVIQASRTTTTQIPVTVVRSGGDSGELNVTVSYESGSITSAQLGWESQIVTFTEGQDQASFNITAPADVSGNFTVAVSTSAAASGLQGVPNAALSARYTLTLPTQGGQPQPGEQDESSTSGASINPVTALLLALLALMSIRSRRKAH